MMDPTSALVNRAILNQRPVTTRFEGPQEAVIVTATTTSAKIIVPAWSTTMQIPGTAPLPPGLTVAPAKGTRCLVVFAGPGVGDPWVIGLTALPAPT